MLGSLVSVAAVAAGAALGGVVTYRATRRRRDRSWPPADDAGASAVEYGLLVAAVAATVVGVVFVLGGAVETLFSDTASTITTCSAPGCPSSGSAATPTATS